MQLNVILCVIYGLALVFSVLTGRVSLVSAAAIEGAGTAVTLSLSLCGMMCLWSAIIELMNQSGISEGLSRVLYPALKLLYPHAAKDRDTISALSTNVSANLLGLGNAATPAGIRAAQGMKRQSGGGTASNELCMLVIMNTASIQLFPTTIASLRASLGAQSPFDILPAVWLTSIISVATGIFAAKIFERFSYHDTLR